MRKKLIFIFIFLVFFMSIIILKPTIKGCFNNIINLININKSNKFIIKDTTTSNYIKLLEKDIKEYKYISNLENCISSMVLYRNPSIWYDTLVINKGKNDNINLYDTVINNSGLVGIITEVLDNSATVSLITNIDKFKKITIGITSDDDIIYGLISKYDKFKNEIIVSEITKDIKLNDNIYAMTTNLTNNYKEGMVIGKVINVVNDENGLSKNAIIKPVVDYNNINYVCVINK